LGRKSLRDVGRELNADSLTYTVTYRGFKGGFSFARLLAKIGYGLAIARFGTNVMDTAYVYYRRYLVSQTMLEGGLEPKVSHQAQQVAFTMQESRLRMMTSTSGLGFLPAYQVRALCIWSS